MKVNRPMLAAPLKDVAKLNYPCLATPKLDGFRCLKIDGQVLSRSFKPIRNRHVVKMMSTLPDGVDGELMVKNFNDAQSVLAREHGEPKFTFYVFDMISDKPYIQRVRELPKLDSKWVIPLVPTLIKGPTGFKKYYQWCLAAGFEGVCTRSPHSPYKCGRSTLREQFLLKYKPFEDSEAVIVGFEELHENTNKAKKNELGLTKRSSHKAGKKPKGILGAFIVKDMKTKVVFKIGTGDNLTQKLRKTIWKRRKKYLGLIVKYRFQDHGKKDKPRFPSFQGFRDKEDL